MSLLESNVNDLGERLIKCPRCNEIHTFKFFYTNVALSLGGISLLPFHRKYTALCLGCRSIFTLSSEKGNIYLHNRDVAITAQDLKIRTEEDA